MDGVGPSAGTDAAGDREEPWADRIGDRQRPRAANQDQEGRLEGVLGVVVVARGRPAGAQHHRAVPAHQHFEGTFRLTPTRDELPQQMAVGQSGEGLTAECAPEVPEERIARSGHAFSSRWTDPTYKSRRRPDSSHNFAAARALLPI
jgi:hypothetical protein